MKRLVLLLCICTAIACGNDDKKLAEPPPEAPLEQSVQTSAFTTAFGSMLNHYYQLKDALVATNDTMAISHAKMLVASADTVMAKNTEADSSINELSNGYLQSIVAESKGLIGEAGIEGKRKSFQMVSDNMYDLIRTVQYKGEKVYHQYCPMAFNDAGAYWLSKSADIKNPYFGKKMLTCGEVKDSLAF